MEDSLNLSEPSPSACKLLGGGQAVAEPTKPCPLLQIHKIHVGSQWLSLLSEPSSKDPQDPRGPQDPQIHRSTESTEPGASPDLLDLSYAAMQITHSALILLLQAAPDSTRSRSEESVCTHNLTCPTHSHLCGLDLTVPLTSACSTCQREKV